MSENKAQEPAQKILALLANHKEFEQSKMKEMTALSDPTLIKYLKSLEKTKSIVYREVGSKKGGKDKKIYSITLEGLWRYFESLDREGSFSSTHPDTLKKVEKVICLFPDMTLFTRKYPLFVEAGLSNEMIRYFILGFKNSFMSYNDRSKQVRERFSREPQVMEIDKFFYGNLTREIDLVALVWPLNDLKLRDRVRDVYRKDAELTTLVKLFLEALIKTLDQEIERYKWFFDG